MSAGLTERIRNGIARKMARKVVPKTVRRGLRRAVSNLRLPKAMLVYHSGYRAPDNPFADSKRASKVLDYLMHEGCISRHHMLRPNRATITQLNLIHPYSYLDKVGEPEQLERVFGQEMFEVDASAIIEQQRWMVGGTIRAARSVLSLLGPRVIINLGGGLHHADADSGHGFCVFNDVAIAIAQLREDGYQRRILIIDLDLHQGDGTRRIFENDSTVFTFSIHANDWDDDPIEHDMSIPLGRAVGDGAYLDAIRKNLPIAFERARPHLVFYVAGVDVAINDKLGEWRITADGILERDKFVRESIGNRPSIWLLAGGYGEDAWRYSARSLAWLLADFDAEIPTATERALQHFRTMSRGLGVDELTRNQDSNDFGISANDLFADLIGPKRPSKFLGFYSAYGIECALGRYGVLDYVRERGITRSDLVMELDHSNGQLVRLFSDDARRDLLIELVVDERSDMPGFRLIWIEWLMLQNPRLTPAQDRPLLPGQQHPGLGCLWHIVGMLLMSCERLSFDGLAFNPAHYHVAALSKAEAFFADPVLQARFLAIHSLLQAEPLYEATMAVTNGEIRDAKTGAVIKWQPGRMVIPASAALKAHFASSEYDAVIQEACKSFDFVWTGTPSVKEKGHA